MVFSQMQLKRRGMFMGAGFCIGLEDLMHQKHVIPKRKKVCYLNDQGQAITSERFFKECPHPDENQRRELSKEIDLAPNRIKFWFQNKRNQRKVQNDRVDSIALRSENGRLRDEYQAFSAVMKNVICPTCDACPPVGEEARKLNVQRLRMENSVLKEMHERLSNEIRNR